jgi:hypothetical protein
MEIETVLFEAKGITRITLALVFKVAIFQKKKFFIPVEKWYVVICQINDAKANRICMYTMSTTVSIQLSMECCWI